MPKNNHLHTLFFLLFISGMICGQKNVRTIKFLNNNWYTAVNDSNKFAHTGFIDTDYPAKNWEQVNIPHNWDQYEGYRRMLHGNRHGYAWYRKTFSTNSAGRGKRYFLFFEGVGSYATVWLNGNQVGYHAGGRTTFTIDVTDVIKTDNSENLLAVRADHPASINDLPWVCGGCSPEWGFSEGSQPFGIFRPVSLIVTNEARVEPFGVHIWNDATVNENSASVNINTEIKNYGGETKKITIVHKLVGRNKETPVEKSVMETLQPGETKIISLKNLEVNNPHLWSVEDPYLYSLVTQIKENGKVIDQEITNYGIRWISWPVYRNDGDNRFYLNGQPVFINGTAEYEHMLGQSHAFTSTQVTARVMQMKAAGFNAFRDAHQPHNLLYQHYWDSLGMLFWTQMAAHIWFDNDDFKTNFKQLLRDWVKERRNCPSVILWGLENESTLPTWFAEECTQIIREMDPTSPSQRLVTTCNGGTGTDWNVIQNWSGTYSGDLYAYDKDISRELLNGEYGAWRSIDLHTEGPFQKNGAYSEDRMCQLMETKIRLAEQAKDSCCGQFQWIFNSHDNPGRTQNGEGLREIDRIGPVNYKGLITPWGEPLDVFYMYRANYADPGQEPMVYIVSHTWPNRWARAGLKDSITVYSNCDEVELFNGYGSNSLGRRKKGEKGGHFQWDSVEINFNMLYAQGFMNGLPVSSDVIILQNLPGAPGFNDMMQGHADHTKPEDNYHYLYRLNCGGPGYKDQNGNIWHADRNRESHGYAGSTSWANQFEGMPSFLASQRRTFDPIKNSMDWKLFQTFRYGRDQLAFHFPLPDGEYLVELYFIEPWYGDGSMNSKGWRVFDIAVNNETLIDNLDIWRETGHDAVLKKTMKVNVSGGEMKIHFPEIASGQAVISAIAIATLSENIKPAGYPPSLIDDLTVGDKKITSGWKIKTWLDIGDQAYSDTAITFVNLPSNFYAAEWIQGPLQSDSHENLKVGFKVQKDADVFVTLNAEMNETPSWFEGFIKQNPYVETSNKNEKLHVYAKRYKKDEVVTLYGISGNICPIVVCPVNRLGYAADQRPKTSYQAKAALLKGNGLIEKGFKNRKYISFTKNMGDTIIWQFKVGLGDEYSLQFHYLNNQRDTIPMKIKITDINGFNVKEEVLYFPPRADSWRSVKTTTGTSINAGTYYVYFMPLGKSGLGIERLDVQ